MFDFDSNDQNIMMKLMMIKCINSWQMCCS